MLKALRYWFTGLFTVRCYAACKMTGRSRKEMIKRAKALVTTGKKFGVEVISPVLEERVQARKGVLKNPSRGLLFKKWTADKNIITWISHTTLLDGADAKSFGMEREYGMNRFWLWKPTISIMPKQPGYTIADFEDDRVFQDDESAFHYLSQYHGNVYRRAKWRLAMLNRSLPKFVIAQLWQFIH